MGQLKGILIGIILGALASGGAAWWMVHQSNMQLTPIAPAPLRSTGSSVPAPTPAQPKAPAVSHGPTAAPPVTPPWANGGVTGGKSQAQVQQELQAARAKSERLHQVMQSYRQMVREGKQTDPKAVSHLIDQLQQATGSSVVNGIDLNALRNNLKVAAQIKGVAQKIEAESQSAHPDKQKIDEYLDQLKQLKGQINRHYIAKSPAAPTGAGEAGSEPSAGSGETPQSGK